MTAKADPSHSWGRGLLVRDFLHAYLIGLLAVVNAAGFWIWRARNAAEMTGEILDAANDVRLVARRLGFRRKSKVHAVDSVDDARVAGVAIIAALMRQVGRATPQQQDSWLLQMQSKFNVSKSEAEKLSVLGDWLVGQRATPSNAVPRIARRLSQLAGPDALPDMDEMISAIFADADDSLPGPVQDGLNDLRARLGN